MLTSRKHNHSPTAARSAGIPYRTYAVPPSDSLIRHEPNKATKASAANVTCRVIRPWFRLYKPSRNMSRQNPFNETSLFFLSPGMLSVIRLVVIPFLSTNSQPQSDNRPASCPVGSARFAIALFPAHPGAAGPRRPASLSAAAMTTAVLRTTSHGSWR
jgi:hypothetical protein